MDSSSNKLYHVHAFDSRNHLDSYFSGKPELSMTFAADLLAFPIECLTSTFKDGHIKGDILIDLSLGSLVHHLYSACEFFKDIITLKVSDRCIMELKRWVDTRTGAFHWGHATQLHVDIEGKSDQLQEKEAKMKSAIQHVVKCNFEIENMTDPIVLPPADCIISVWLLDVISKDKDDYIKYFRKLSRLLKPGGHILLIGCCGTTFITVGKEKFHVLNCDEEFLKKAVTGEGFIIDCFKVQTRTAEKTDILDYKAITYMVAHKEK